ncbi:MAG: hypothetical protein HOY79_16125 [Streptomyces sp.]|nr:hypothetical protein [Streptomyces sp.]
MDTHVHDRRRFLALTAEATATPLLPVRAQARADTTGPRSDDPVRLTVRPENLLLFEADGPQGPGRLIGTR